MAYLPEDGGNWKLAQDNTYGGSSKGWSYELLSGIGNERALTFGTKKLIGRKTESAEGMGKLGSG
ncbi:MAG TPA: hypothetical protein PLT27_03290 [Nitrospira sp.]|nr:hypothetical protein [Nitrospira sp.]